MLDLRSFRIPWASLVPLLVFPLLGQDGCDTCPEPTDSCQQAVFYAGTGECEVRNREDGVACDDQGTPGVCSNGQCQASQAGECAGDQIYSICDDPVGEAPAGACLGGACVGACMDDSCVLAAPADQCLKVGVGRINCCSQLGCTLASGAYCTQPLPNDTKCDPTGFEPPGDPTQTGTCQNGTCVADTGICAGLVCRTEASDPCARDFCDESVGACSEFTIKSFQPCALSRDVEAVCDGGTCTFRGFPGGCQSECEDGNNCTSDLCEILEDDTIVCTNSYIGDGKACLNGERGVCQFGRCQPTLTSQRCSSDGQCDDGNACTVDACNRSLGFCTVESLKPDLEVCGPGGVCWFGECVVDLCIDRDCDDGNSCTVDECIPPYGICDRTSVPTGQPCIGEPGQCAFGRCQPVIGSSSPPPIGF